MKSETTPKEVFDQYRRGVAYNRSIGLYERVEENENFFIGRQWEGVDAPDLDKPVLNILGRVVSYFVSMISSDSVAVAVGPLGRARTDELARETEVIGAQLERLFEQNDLAARSKDILRDAAVRGDAYLHLYFDADAPTGQAARGAIRAESVDCTDVCYGNPLSDDKEAQPYLIIAARRPAEAVRDEMRRAGRPRREIDAVIPDTDEAGALPFEPEGQVTVLCRYQKREGTVWVTRCTRAAVVMPETDTGYRRYPLAAMQWERVRGSCHGQAAVTGLIPNQIAINKLFAMAVKYQKDLAFPKLLYDRTKIERWSNRIGAIGVNGDPSSAVVRYAGGAEMSGQVLQIIDRLISYTRDLMGASDAALGNVKPDNTSAIVAVQQSTALPLESRRRAFYQMMEETARVFLDMTAVDYGVRRVVRTDADGAQSECDFDFSALSDALLELRVDVGQSGYWSELGQLATLDNLFAKGIITDAVDYLEAVPEGRVRNKGRLLESLRRRRAARREDGGDPKGKEVMEDALSLV